MKKILLMFVFPMWIFATHGIPRIEDSAKGRDTIIKVLTHENLDGALIEIKGGFRVENAATGKKITSSFFSKRNYLSPTPSGIKWGGVLSGHHQIKITPSSKDTTFLVNGIQYAGNLYAYSIASNVCLIVEVEVDDYVKSIISGTFCNRKVHQATLETLAIVMRTNLYDKISSSVNPFWDIKASEHKFKGSSLLQIDSRADAACISTKDLIMIHNNRPFPAMWTENSAGKTADYKAIFRKNANTPPGVFVPFTQKSREKTAWKASISRKDLEKIASIGTIVSLEMRKDKATQKIYGVRVKSRDNSVKDISFVKIQDTIGADRIQSNDCFIHLIDNRVEFSGYGKGLGVGICLHSAEQMASTGKPTAKILSQFFPGTKVIKLEFVPQVFFEEESIPNGD